MMERVGGVTTRRSEDGWDLRSRLTLLPPRLVFALPTSLAAAVQKCGKRKIWLDPAECTEISMANSRQNIRKLVKDGFIMKKPCLIHSRDRVRKRLADKAKGRHTGMGKRRGTREARMPSKVLWIRKQRVLRRLLRKYRELKKIDKHMYKELYVLAKGNRFKNKRTLIENIHSKKKEKERETKLEQQAEARKLRSKNAKRRKEQRKEEEQRKKEAAQAADE